MKFHIYSGIDLYCQQCGCKRRTTVENGEKIYPHRPDLADKVFLQCEICGNYVSADELRPHDTYKKWKKRHDKKVIPTSDCRKMRRKIHAIIDDIWQSGIMERSYIYKRLSEATGTNYHNGSLNDPVIAEKAYNEAMKLQREARTLGYVPKRGESL